MHRNYWQKIVEDSLLMGINLHTIQFTDDPFFTEVINAPKRWEPRIYSSHHQAVEKLGKGMEVTALSPDGKIIASGSRDTTIREIWLYYTSGKVCASIIFDHFAEH